MKNSLYLFVAFLLMSIPIHAQESITISGIVTEEITDAPLVGATVLVKNTQNATITDVNGRYSIVANKNDVLVFRLVGMASKEVKVTDREVVNVKLASNFEANEVVVIGYGTARKSDLTGAVSSLNTGEALKTNPISITQALQGRIAGVNVIQSDGAPGAAMKIQIRGANSFTSNTEPLYVIDGVPFEAPGTPSGGAGRSVNALSFINPQDIESLEVLKDASATAIYGARGSNGVILITTKKGKQGEDKIQVGANFSTSHWINKVKFLDGYEYAIYANERQRNHQKYHNGGPYPTPEYSGTWEYNDKTGYYKYRPSPQDFLNGYLDGGTDWTDVISQTALTQEYTLNYSGANEKGDYFISGSFLDQEGIIYGSGYNRVTLRSNINRNLRSYLRAGVNVQFTSSETEFAVADWASADIFKNAIYYRPTESVFHPVTMDPNQEEFYWATNPYVAVRSLNDNTSGKNIHISSYMSIDFLKNFQFKQTLGYGYNYSHRRAYYGSDTRAAYLVGGTGTQSDYWNTNILHESLLTYNKTINNIHKINAVGAFTFEEYNYGSKGMTASYFPNDLLQMWDMGNTLEPEAKSLSSGRGRSRIMSLLGRLNYTLNDRYLFTGSLRRDGSSKFVKDHKFADFYSFAFAWRASEEPFIKKLNMFSNLKPRISYGETGNESIHNYQTLQLLTESNVALAGNVYPGYAEAVWKGPLNKNLIWETTEQFNAGIDMGFFDHRLNITVDAYYKKTRDLLQKVAIPSSSGFSSMMSNFGHVKNKGLEISVQANILTQTPLKWDVNANIYWNRNKIGGLDGDQFASGLFYLVDQVFIQRNGYPIGTIFGYVHDGYYDNEAEVRANPENTGKSDADMLAMIGEEKYKNLDKDDTSISVTDRTIIGDVNPDYQFGITNNFTWRNFSFSFFIQGNIGGDIINANILQNLSSSDSPANIPKFIFNNRWTESNPGKAEFPKPNHGYSRTVRFSDRYIEDATYIRLKNINIGYNLNNPLPYISNVNIYANFSNILTITNYRWYDPDVNSFSDTARRGVDMSAYPTSATISGGVRLTF